MTLDGVIHSLKIEIVVSAMNGMHYQRVLKKNALIIVLRDDTSFRSVWTGSFNIRTKNHSYQRIIYALYFKNPRRCSILHD